MCTLFRYSAALINYARFPRHVYTFLNESVFIIVEIRHRFSDRTLVKMINTSNVQDTFCAACFDAEISRRNNSGFPTTCYYGDRKLASRSRITLLFRPCTLREVWEFLSFLSCQNSSGSVKNGEVPSKGTRIGAYRVFFFHSIRYASNEG